MSGTSAGEGIAELIIGDVPDVPVPPFPARDDVPSPDISVPLPADPEPAPPLTPPPCPDPEKPDEPVPPDPFPLPRPVPDPLIPMPGGATVCVPKLATSDFPPAPIPVPLLPNPVRPNDGAGAMTCSFPLNEPLPFPPGSWPGIIPI